jgi:DNA helicase-2/ATP-dependent DNA helicase PcrA
VDRERILEGLNDEQRRAVEAVRGPVCILAGAGSGKTTTITRRIAWQVASSTFSPDSILAVTFTDKAAGELRERLKALGVSGVDARTFHSAAYAQLRRFSAEPPERVLSSKALPLRKIANSLPAPYKFRPAGDLATEIEWAKNHRLTPATYVGGLEGHAPPIPVDLMHRVFAEYERRKEESGWADFEDLLELTIRVFDHDEAALAALRANLLAITVDEYQDVNLLQQTLLERWLGDRDELCAVGDDYQSIYAFTGATPAYLLDMPRRFPRATVVRLEANYRSSPEVLEQANRLVPRLGGAEKVLRATRPGGPVPDARVHAGPEAEATAIVERIRALSSEGVAYEEMAIFTRTNARSADFEPALVEAGIPFQGSAFLGRDAARQLLKRLRGSGQRGVAQEVRRVATEQGWTPNPPDRIGERELTRQNDLARLVGLAEQFDDGERDVAAFVQHLEERFGDRGAARRGVHLLTYHRAKGLEFDAVFLPRLEERELPCRPAVTAGEDALAEERRLLYVGLTRARRWLWLSWTARAKPSRFLAELGIQAGPQQRREDAELPPLYRELKAWRRERSKADEVPAYVVFHDATLAEIATREPRTLGELATIPGVGPTKLDRYGPDVLAVVTAA